MNGEKTLYINDIRSPVSQVLIEGTENLQLKALYLYGLSRLACVDMQECGFYLYDYPDRNVIAVMNRTPSIRNYYEYNAFGEPKISISSVPNPFTYAGENYENDAQTGFMTAIKQGNEIIKLFSYDPQGRVTKISDSLGYALHKTYDERSRLTTVGDLKGGFVYAYNDRDQITQVASPFGTMCYSYDEIGNLIEITDANDNKTQLEYDQCYNIVKLIDAEYGITHYEYNDRLLNRVILPNGSSKTILYDVMNRPIREIIGH